jgi:sulfite reductase (ferredoxin)
VADIGFYGINRNVNGYQVPHFQVLLGGKLRDNGGEYGVPVAAIPSKRVPEALLRITERYVQNRAKGESFQDFVRRVGKKEMKEMLEDLTKIPPHNEAPSYYADWGDPREFTLEDLGTGECAGEVVSQSEFTFAASERELFEAHIFLESGDLDKAAQMAYRSMLSAAQALVRTQLYYVSDDEGEIIAEFRKRFCDTQLFYDKYAGSKFADYLFHAKDTTSREVAIDVDLATQLVQEAQLFIDAAHSCHNKLTSMTAASRAATIAGTAGTGEG